MHKNPCLKTETNNTEKRRIKIDQEKIDDATCQTSWRVRYDNKFLFREFTHHCREVIILFH